MPYARSPALCFWIDSDTFPQTTEPSLRRYRFSSEKFGNLPPHERLVVIEAGRQIFGVGDVLEAPYQQLFSRVAEEVAEFIIHEQESPFGVNMSDADGRVLEGATEPLFALTQRLLGHTRDWIGSPPLNGADAMPQPAQRFAEQADDRSNQSRV